MKRGILTVGIICTPFSFEGPKRTKVCHKTFNISRLQLKESKNWRNQWTR
jgi:cell division GTPase FtsZ